jgi:hypothetical protein
MEHLFTTELKTGGKNVTYDVIFDNEHYAFIPTTGNREITFEVHRLHDEWHGLTNVDEEMRSQAIASLEKYLLAQH